MSREWVTPKQNLKKIHERKKNTHTHKMRIVFDLNQIYSLDNANKKFN